MIRLSEPASHQPTVTPARPHNWAGNVEYSTATLLDAHTVQQVCDVVRAQPQLTTLGTRHCFNRIADSRHALLRSDSFAESIGIDPVARTVTVNAGITYGRLASALDAQGYALHNLASLPHISVAGSCATGTHGSGEDNGTLSSAVAALDLVTASGDLLHLSRAQSGDDFRGAVVGLGALGVVVRITLDIEPRYDMRQSVYVDMPLHAARDHFDEIQASAYSVSLFTDWHSKRCNAWLKTRVGEVANTDVAILFGAARASHDVHPIADVSAEHCTAQCGVAGPWHERLPHFRLNFTPGSGKELQSEYFVPRHHAREAMLAVERLGAQIAPYLLISEIRTIAADDLWLSPAYGRPTVALHFTWTPDGNAVGQLLPVLECELAPFDARPHWGKLFSHTGAQLADVYERLPDFAAMANRFDPHKKFRNAFLETTVFAER